MSSTQFLSFVLGVLCAALLLESAAAQAAQELDSPQGHSNLPYCSSVSKLNPLSFLTLNFDDVIEPGHRDFDLDLAKYNIPGYVITAYNITVCDASGPTTPEIVTIDDTRSYIERHGVRSGTTYATLSISVSYQKRHRIITSTERSTVKNVLGTASG